MSAQSPAVEVAVPGGAELGEGATWDPVTARLIWVDIYGRVIHFFDPATGEDAVMAVTGTPGVAIPRRGSGLVLAAGHGFSVLDPDGSQHQIVELEQRDIDARMNDGNCDSAGRFWVGTTGIHEEEGAGALYRLDPDLSVTTVLDRVTCSNGIDWSPDERLMYYIDTGERRIDVFDFDLDSATIANRRPFAAVRGRRGVPGWADGRRRGRRLGGLLGRCAVRRFTPDGALERTIYLPTTNITSCAFGGPGLAELYITSAREGLNPEQLEAEPHAGALFVCTPGSHRPAPAPVRGLAPGRSDEWAVGPGGAPRHVVPATAPPWIWLDSPAAKRQYFALERSRTAPEDRCHGVTVAAEGRRPRRRHWGNARAHHRSGIQHEGSRHE